MEILQSGNTLGVEQCEKCNCIFRYVKNDIKINTRKCLSIKEHTTFVEDIPYEEYVNCPECNHKNVLTTAISL